MNYTSFLLRLLFYKMLSKYCFHQVSRRALFTTNIKGVLAAVGDTSRLVSCSSHEGVYSSSSLHFYSTVANKHVNSNLTPFIPTFDVSLKRYLSTTASASLDQNEKKKEQVGFKKLSPELEQLLRSEFEVRKKDYSICSTYLYASQYISNNPISFF